MEHYSRLGRRTFYPNRNNRLYVTAAAIAVFVSRRLRTLTRRLAELAAEIHALKASNEQMRVENRKMKAAIAEIRGAPTHPRRKAREVAPGVSVPVVSPPPPGATPAFVTADKQLQFGAITITPGGFLAGESVFRSKTTNSDINSAWNNIPFKNNPLSRTNESRLTGRQSRLALLAEGVITPSMVASGYAEFDFLGAGTTSNATDTNSYAPRIRQLYAALDMENLGLHFAGGQMWSLTTLNSKGITLRNEVTPPTIDGQFLPGFVFARQAGVRLTKDFNKSLWTSLALEEAQTTFPGGVTAACQGTALTDAAGASAVSVPVSPTVNAICAGTASGAGFSQYGQPYSLNHVPDVIGKIAYEAHLSDRDVHLEAMGLYKDLYSASAPAVAGVSVPGLLATHDTAGYGFGAGLILPVIPRRLDFQAQGMAGRGIGRYGAGLLPDSTINPQGALKPIGEVIGLAGLTAHVTSAMDVYAFGGIERENRAYSTVTTAAGGTAFFGYGAPDAANFGCNIVNAPASTCAGQGQTLWQVTGGVWDKIYKGAFGEVRVGLQYSYTQREAFKTQANVTTVTGGLPQTVAQQNEPFSPKTSENTVMTSVRYYPFQ